VLTKAYTTLASTLLLEVVHLLPVQHLLVLLLKHDLLPVPMQQPWL
jgi:hypothetical protein